MEKMMENWDKQKNWLVPGAQDKENEDPFKQLEPKNDPEKVLTGEKPEGVMERFIRGEKPNAKTQNDRPNRPRDLDRTRDRDRTNNKFDPRGKENSENKDKDETDDDSRDRNDNSQSNGLAEFDLKRFIRQQDQPNFLNSELPKASQLFRSGSFGNPQARESIADRAKDREMDAKRAADFMQILKPRSPGSAFAATGVNDPINSPDLTRREMNPVLPQTDSGSRSPFGAPPPSPASRIQDNNMFGVTGPAASSIAPAISSPLPHPEPGRNRSVVIEPPRRIF
jgi:hypothetical protein